MTRQNTSEVCSPPSAAVVCTVYSMTRTVTAGRRSAALVRPVGAVGQARTGLRVKLAEARHDVRAGPEEGAAADQTTSVRQHHHARPERPAGPRPAAARRRCSGRSPRPAGCRSRTRPPRPTGLRERPVPGLVHGRPKTPRSCRCPARPSPTRPSRPRAARSRTPPARRPPPSAPPPARTASAPDQRPASPGPATARRCSAATTAALAGIDPSPGASFPASRSAPRCCLPLPSLAITCPYPQFRPRNSHNARTKYTISRPAAGAAAPASRHLDDLIDQLRRNALSHPHRDPVRQPAVRREPLRPS